MSVDSIFTKERKLSATARIGASELNEKTLDEKIGDTPLLDLRALIPRSISSRADVTLRAKAEWFNAGGSVKSRPALNMIRDGEKTGRLKKGMTILDSTSGNTGVAYAMIGMIKGYRVKLVMPRNVCGERKQLMSSAYHAEIVYSSEFEGSDGAILLCREIFDKDPETYFWPDQYSNDANWRAHYDTTAPEIIAQTAGKLTHFLAGLGTTGTIMGVSRGLKNRLGAERAKTFGIEPEEELHGIEGLKNMKNSIVPKIYRPDELDGIVKVKTEEAYEMTRRILNEYGLNVGSSSGAAVAGALKTAAKLNEAHIVTLLPDSCECEFATGDFNRAVDEGSAEKKDELA